MKKIVILSLSIIGLTMMSFKSSENFNVRKSNEFKAKKEVVVNTFGFDKGQRKNCAPPGATTPAKCCDRKFCLVSNVETNNDDITVANYFEGTIEVINDNTLAINILHNKIHSSVFTYWLINNTFEREYFPLDNSVSIKFGKTNIAFSEGKYPVVKTVTGYKIEINYQTITGE